MRLLYYLFMIRLPSARCTEWLDAEPGHCILVSDLSPTLLADEMGCLHVYIQARDFCKCVVISFYSFGMARSDHLDK